MAKATEEQLIKRWLTPKGKKIRAKIIEHIREEKWEQLLLGFPFVEESLSERDLRCINLKEADLSNADLEQASLWKADLSSANLREASLWNAYLWGADLSEADLRGANLSEANLQETNLEQANLRSADLSYARLWEASLWSANLCKADLMGANLRGAYLSEANLRGTDLIEANLSETNLEGADLRSAVLWGADLRGADLLGADLRGADLSSCILIRTDISRANLTDAYIYGISTWDIIIDKQTMMKNLIISKNPLITVDDIEIAQFIYTILNNEKIRNVINIMRTKGVLILGSFCDDKKSKITPKKILDKIKEELLKKNYVPIVFDFDPSKKLDLISTVKTLALLSSFIIVDLSTPAGQFIEIGNLVREFPIPFIPIASNETKHITSMFGKKALGNYHWFKKDIICYSIADFNKQLPKVIESEIIPWVKNKNRDLEKERKD